jgi:hypothetical protein
VLQQRQRRPAGDLAGALPGAASVLLVDIQPPPRSPPRKLKFTITLHAGEFDSDSDSQDDTDSSKDCFRGYIPPVPRGDALRVFWCLARTGALSTPTLCIDGAS